MQHDDVQQLPGTQRRCVNDRRVQLFPLRSRYRVAAIKEGLLVVTDRDEELAIGGDGGVIDREGEV